MPSTRFTCDMRLPESARLELAELDRRIRGQAKRTAILEFDFCAAVIAGVQLGALRDREVDERAFKTNAGVFVDLYRSLNVAEADDAGLRIGQSGQRQKCAG